MTTDSQGCVAVALEALPLQSLELVLNLCPQPLALVCLCTSNLPIRIANTGFVSKVFQKGRLPEGTSLLGWWPQHVHSEIHAILSELKFGKEVQLALPSKMRLNECTLKIIPLKNPSGKIVQGLLTLCESTPRKLFPNSTNNLSRHWEIQSLHSSPQNRLEKLGDLFNSMEDCICLTDGDGIITAASPGLLNRLGYTQDDLDYCRLSWESLTPDGDSSLTQWLQSLNGDDFHSQDHLKTLKHKHGYALNFRVTLLKVPSPESEPDFFILLRDYQDQVLPDVFQEKLALLQRLNQQCLWEWDFQKDKVLWHPPPEAQKSVDTSLQHFIPFQACYEQIHPNDRKRIWDSLYQTLDQKQEQWSAWFRVISDTAEAPLLGVANAVIAYENTHPKTMIGITLQANCPSQSNIDDAFQESPAEL